MAFDAGEVRAVLGADFRPGGFKAFDRAMINSGRSMRNFESQVARSADRTSRSHHNMSRAIGVGVVGSLTLLGAAAVKSVQAFEGFNRQMQTAKAVSKASAAEMKTLDAATKKIGVTTKYSATEAAGASVELIKAGMTMKQVIGGGLTAALSLAAAGDLELADAAKYTSNAMNMFGIEAGKASTISDGLAKAANDTTADVGDFGMALSQGGSAAKMAGLSFQDTMVILEALAKQGIKNSDAGTSMKTSLLQLLSPTKKQAELQKELGLSFVNRNGQMKNGIQISRELHKATKDMNQAERLATFEKLAGTDGIRTLNALYSTGAKTLELYTKGQNLAGEASRVGREKQMGLAGSIDKAKASAQTALVIIGEQLAPTVANAADGFSRFIKEAASSGDLADFGQGIADAAHDVEDLAKQFYTLGQSATSALTPATGALRGLASAMPDGSAISILGGVAAGFLTLRSAQAVEPGVRRLGGSINAAMEAGRKANRAQDIASSFAAAGMMAQRTDKDFTGLRSKTAGLRAGLGSMVGGLGATVAGLGPLGGLALAAGAGFMVYSYAQQRAAANASELAAKAHAAGEAVQTAADQATQAALSVIQAEQDKAALEDLVDQRDAARKKGQTARVKELNRLIAGAKIGADESSGKAKKDVSDIPARATEKYLAAQGGVDAANRKLTKSTEGLTNARATLADAEKMGNKQLIADAKANVAAKEKEAAARRKSYEAARQDAENLKKLSLMAGLSQQRALAKSGGIKVGDASGFRTLQGLLRSAPKAVKTKILVEGDSAAVGKLGRIALSLKGIVPRKKIQAILEGGGSVESILKRLSREARKSEKKRIQAILDGGGSAEAKLKALAKLNIKDKRFRAILEGEGSAQQKLDQLNGFKFRSKVIDVSLSQSNFNVTVNARGGSTKLSQAASGAKRGEKAGAALVGEGRDREYVVNSSTGEGYVADGPMFTTLGDHDYVVPIEPAYRGRAMGLFGMLARDLGVPGYKGGKKGTKPPPGQAKFPIPKAHERDRAGMSMSLEDLESRSTNAKAKYEKHKGKKGAKKYKGLYEKAHRKYLDAKKFADGIAKQDDLVEIAENSMNLAAKNKDSKTFNTANTKRTNALSNLHRWLERAVKLAPKNSKWERELQKRLGQVKLSEKDGGPAMEEGGDYLTKDESTRLEAAETLASQAALTDGLDDDKSALGSIQSIREAIYGRVVSAHAPNSVIKDAADQLKQARDDVANLTSTVSPDQQAVIDQANARADASAKDAAANSAALQAFTGAGDIGSGGRNAWEAAGGITVNNNIQTLHPADPAMMSGIAGVTMAGIAAGGYVPTSRVKTGI